MSVRYRDSWYPSLSPHGGWHFTDLTKTIPIRHINCLPLKQPLAPLWSKKAENPESGRSRFFFPSIVLDENYSYHINFFSLDVEGGELAVLKSIDFSDVRFDVMVVEDLYDNVTDIERLLQSKGYVYHKRVEWNKWFIHSDFKPTQMQQEMQHMRQTKAAESMQQIRRNIFSEEQMNQMQQEQIEEIQQIQSVSSMRDRDSGRSSSIRLESGGYRHGQ
jgi:hypothetical protein